MSSSLHIVRELRALRLRLKISIPELAARMGCSPGQINNYEHARKGYANPSANYIIKWAWALGHRIQLAQLEDGEGAPYGGLLPGSDLRSSGDRDR